MPGILDWITEKAKAQYAKGAPYREAVGGLLQGDMNKVNQALSKNVSSAKKLNELGIKGTRFKDTMSSTPEQRFNNYTIFDPNTIKILERNGLLLP